MISTALSAFSDVVHMLLRNQVEKGAVMENLDLDLLCLEETINEGCVAHLSHPHIATTNPSPCSVRLPWANDWFFRAPPTVSSWKWIQRRWLPRVRQPKTDTEIVADGLTRR